MLRYEMLFFAIAVVLCNWSLLHGESLSSLAYRAAAVQAGEWWRIFTHPFVHLSWYHLFFDGSAFFVLYSGLEEKSALRRIFYVIAAAAGSLLAALYSAPAIYDVGLCGLSGIAHGLLAISAVEMLFSGDKTIVRVGIISFIIIIGKSFLEAATGHLAFSFIHIGNIGTPIAVCHTGGTIGGLAAWIAFRFVQRNKPNEPKAISC